MLIEMNLICFMKRIYIKPFEPEKLSVVLLCKKLVKFSKLPSFCVSFKKFKKKLLRIALPSELFLNFQKGLDGYKFPVYLTSSCPKNETGWKERASAINCTAQHGYLCLPNENLTELLEFCYTEPRIWILKGTWKPLGISEKGSNLKLIF